MDNYNEFGVNNNDEFFEENNYKDDKKRWDKTWATILMTTILKT